MVMTSEEIQQIKNGLLHMSDKKRSYIERSMLDVLGNNNHQEEGDIEIRKSLTSSQQSIYIALITIATEARMEREKIMGR